MALLEMRNITKSFYGKAANEDVDLLLEKGEIHALLGENGAGKTTLMNILYGIYPKDHGEIFWKGEEAGFSTPREALAAGIGMVHQHFMLVPTMTVSQNITMGLKSPGYPLTDRAAVDRKIRVLSGRYGLDVNPDALVRDLSVGEQQRVEIMKLLYRDAELLILDEPTAVLTPGETENLFVILRQLKAEGHSVILITHRIPEIMAVTDRISVLRAGRKVAERATADTEGKELSRLMIGRELKTVSLPEPTGARRACGAEEAGGGERPWDGLHLEKICCREKGRSRLEELSLEIRPGEILGIAGVDGNGQKELAECIAGIRKTDAGSIRLDGRDLTDLKAAARYGAGVAYISDDRHHDSLVLDMSLQENYLLNTRLRKSHSRRGFLGKKRSRAEVEKIITDYEIKCTGPDQKIGLLSGGNQQKLILAREFACDPGLIIAFQPNRGLDIGAAEFIREKLLEHRARGAAILLISTDLNEILSLSDRISVIFEGHLSPSMENSEKIDTLQIGRLMAGEGMNP